MRATSCLVSLSALASSSALVTPGIVRMIRGARGNSALRCLACRHNRLSSVAALGRSTVVNRVSTAKMTSDATTPAAGEVAAETAAAITAGTYTELARLDIRVGKILEMSRHPEAHSLYVKKMDVGDSEDGPRTVVSGLVQFCKESDLLGKYVIVLCNLKPVSMKGVLSAGMILCSSNEDHTRVEPLCPPADVPAGERITFKGHAQSPIDAGNRAGKAWKRVSKTLVVNDDNVATFTGEMLPAAFMTSKGPVTAALPGTIS